VSAARPSSGLESKPPVLAVTGGSGFIGLSLIEHLLKAGHSVLAHAMEPLPPMALATFTAYPGRLITVQGDIGDARLGQCLADHRVTHLFHGAAITAAQAREKVATRQILEVNLMGTVNALDACVHAGVQTVVLASSSAVYGAAIFEGQDLDESHPPAPANLYGIGKVAIEGIGQRYQALHGLRVANARITAAFGPWERDTGLRDMLWPLCYLARLAVDGREAVLPAALPVQAWVYGPDVAAGLLHLLDMKAPPHRVFNICSGEMWGEVMTRWADTLAQHFPGFRWRRSADPAEVNVRFTEFRPRGRMDIARIQATGWQPRFGPDAAYANYAAWLSEYPDAL